MESNDSPEIPDRGETSDIPSLPSGGLIGAVWEPQVSTEYKVIGAGCLGTELLP